MLMSIARVQIFELGEFFLKTSKHISGNKIWGKDWGRKGGFRRNQGDGEE